MLAELGEIIMNGGTFSFTSFVPTKIAGTSHLPKKEALVKGIKEAKENDWPLIIISFKDDVGKDKTLSSLRVLKVEGTHISSSHPQFVRFVDDGNYCIVRSDRL